MRIQKIIVGESKVPLKVPFKTALRTVADVHSLIFMIETDTGLIGYGEAPATAVITGDVLDSMRAGLAVIAPLLIGKELNHFNRLLCLIQNALLHHSSLKAALEIALFDLRAQQFSVPLYQLLGGPAIASNASAVRVKTDITVSLNDVATMVDDCLRALADGFDALKIKLGGRSARTDVECVLAIHQAVKGRASLRLDANQGWSPKQAAQIIRHIENAGVEVELVEQPVNARDLLGLKFVTDHSMAPIVADEAVFDCQDALHVLSTQSADIINIKLMKTAGLSQAIEIANLTRRFQRTCMIGCMLEGAISVTAAAHFAIAYQDVIPYVDLDGPQLCNGSAIVGGVEVQGPWLNLSNKPGLGVDRVLELLSLQTYD